MLKRIAIAALPVVLMVGTASAQTVQPTGPYALGRRTLFLVDSARKEPATSDPNDRRAVTINIWYPLKAGEAARTAAYMPNAQKYEGVVSSEAVETWARLSSAVYEDGPAAPGPFPVLLFSHGFNSRSASYSSWLMEVASHGFVVVGVDHPYLGKVATSAPRATDADDSAFPSQKYADMFYADDLNFVRDQLVKLNKADAVLAGRLQLNMMFGAGHSSGFGAAMSAFEALYPALKGLISFDSGLSRFARERGIPAPLLLMRADSPTYTDIFVRRPTTHPRGTIYDSAAVRQLKLGLLDMHVLGTGHNAVLDEYVFLNGVERDRAIENLQLISRYTIAFMSSIIRDGKPSVVVRPADTARIKLDVVSLAPLRASQAAPLKCTPESGILSSIVKNDLAEELSSRTAGIALVLVGNNTTILECVGGFTALRTRMPVTSETAFHTASLSKTAVASMVMRLNEQGRLPLDAEITTGITIRSLLQHTSGLPDVQDYHWTSPDLSADALQRNARLVTQVAVSSVHGGARYTNSGFDVLGAVIEKVTGRAFADVMKSDLLQPIGMSQSSFDPRTLTVQRAEGHTLIAGSLQQTDIVPFNPAHSPSSTLWSTSSDMATWLRFHLNRGQAQGRHIIPQRAYALMWDTTVPFLGDNGRPVDRRAGLGWITGTRLNHFAVWHPGSDVGYAAYLMLIPDSTIGVAVLCNSDACDAAGVAQRTLAAGLTRAQFMANN